MTRRKTVAASGASRAASGGERTPSDPQLAWLRRGLTQPGGKLPLFDDAGKRVGNSTVTSCIKAGWAEPWFDNPLKPDWKVCRLTDAGRAVVAKATIVQVDFSKRRSAAHVAAGEAEAPIELKTKRS